VVARVRVGLRTHLGVSQQLLHRDVNNATSTPTPLITTSYALRNPTDRYNPKVATPVSGCEKQYPGYTKNQVTAAALRKTDPAYNNALAQVFHQWVTMCTFTPPAAGDYYLQIRTNVALGGTSDGQGGYQNNNQVYTQTGDNPSVAGSGNNRFALRATGTQRGAVSISGFQAMSIYANHTGANTTFNLVRVIPAAAAKTLDIGFYDVGDASQPGTVTVLPPLDSNLGSSIATCTGAGVVNGAIPGCKLTNVSSGSGWNGQYENLKISIPGNYTCTYPPAGGCWWRLQVQFPGGVNDTTTWTASVDGDLIRLIK
jgi:hypothetical protein